MTQAIRAKILTPLSAAHGGGLRYLEDGLLRIDDAGRIAAAIPFDGPEEGTPILDLRPAVVLPGFVDAHVHFPQARIVGSASGPLLEWLDRSVFPEEARFSDEAYARAVAPEFVRAMLEVGTTTAAIFASSHPVATSVLFEELARSGMRAVAGLTLMDQRCPDDLRLAADRAIGASIELCDRWHGHDRGRLRFAITPRFALSCSRRLMESAGRLAADRKLHVQTHVAENRAEGVQTLAAHRYAKDYAGVYDAVGLLGPQTVLAHAIHVTPLEWDRIAERGARVAHCPDSNFFLGSGRMQLDPARERGIHVALGTDVGAGRTFSVRRTMASAYDNALCLERPVAPAELLRMATLGGAATLGLEGEIGSIEPGKDADLVVVDLPGHVRTEDEVLSHVVFASDVTRVSRAYVRGRRLDGAPV